MIARTPGVCGGRACVRGTRILVHGIVDGAMAGLTDAELGTRHRVTPDVLRAVWRYTARYPAAVAKDAVQIVVILEGLRHRTDAYAQKRRALWRHIDARERRFYAVNARTLARRRLGMPDSV